MSGGAAGIEPALYLINTMIYCQVLTRCCLTIDRTVVEDGMDVLYSVKYGVKWDAFPVSSCRRS